jgi:hypothetical protein
MIGGGAVSLFMPYTWLGHWELTCEVFSSTASDVTKIRQAESQVSSTNPLVNSTMYQW